MQSVINQKRSLAVRSMLAYFFEPFESSFMVCFSKINCLMTKPSKWHVHPAKTQISLGIRPVWSESSLMWDWADAQTDLSLRMAHSRFVGFVMRRLKCCTGLSTASRPIMNVRFYSLPSFAESQGAASLQGIDPEGSRLLHNSPPPPDVSTYSNKGNPIQKPSFVVNREDSTIRGDSIPPFPPKPKVPLLRGETEDSLNMLGEFLR